MPQSLADLAKKHRDSRTGQPARTYTDKDVAFPDYMSWRASRKKAGGAEAADTSRATYNKLSKARSEQQRRDLATGQAEGLKGLKPPDAGPSPAATPKKKDDEEEEEG